MAKWILYFCCGMAAGYILIAPLEGGLSPDVQNAALTRKLTVYQGKTPERTMENCTLQMVETANLAGVVSRHKVRMCR
jgi:hypothetical protein